MSSNTEPTSNSMKFTPMPMSALLANLMPLKPEESPNNSEGSGDESDNDVGSTVTKKPIAPIALKQEFSTPSLKVSHPKEIKAFASEKKVAHNDNNNKENSDNIWLSNQTYPSKDSIISQGTYNKIPRSTQKDNDPSRTALRDVRSLNNCSSEVKKRSVLMPHDSNPRIMQTQASSTHIKTPELIRPPSSQTKKTATPKIKSGIRKFTPSSGRHSNKKTPVVKTMQNRDKVRCELFSQKKEDPPLRKDLLPPASVPETPMSRKQVPVSYAATPSHPQGIITEKSKVLFKARYIKDKKYMFIKPLGTGGSSEVYKVLDINGGHEYAVKSVYLSNDPDLAQGYINEVRLLRELQNSDRVIKLYDYEYDKTENILRMVLEVGETDLSSFMKARGAGGLPPALVLHYWEEMLHAVNYIHENGVIHADLKPANFLLVSGRLKLIDFGIASAISSDATSVVRAQATGTYSYISPEALVGGAGGYGVAHGDAPIKISFRSDVWSLGCILYSMVYGRTPFGHIPNLAKLAAILDPNHRITYPPTEHLPQSLISALKWCLTYNARCRPTVRDLLAIPYLQPATKPPLPHGLVDKLQHSLTAQEFKVLMQRLQ